MKILIFWLLASLIGAIFHVLIGFVAWVIEDGSSILDSNLIFEMIGFFVFSVPVSLFILIPTVITNGLLMVLTSITDWIGYVVAVSLAVGFSCWIGFNDPKFFDTASSVIVFATASAIGAIAFWRMTTKQDRTNQRSQADSLQSRDSAG
ncbi:hypothetical protein VSU19_09580 [Verrucomicrobiales bacterium BCK34]|nr:hypothetical protein [Verrucomicrobiales bacterium BCK34]